MPQPGELLSGVRILDLTRLLPGPLCTQHLADLGAEVIKVEDTRGGDYGRYGLGTGSDDDPGYFDLVNRGKRSIAVDLKSPEGREFFQRLTRSAHAIVESYRPGVMKRLGLDYEQLREVNPAIVFCSITGYGQSGPLAKQAGHDLNYCALTGMTEQTGVPGELPVIPAFQIADLAGGTLTATTALLAGLYQARATGEGVQLDVAMTDSVMVHSVLNLAMYRHQQAVPARGAGVLNGGAPCYGVYETADKRYMAVAALERKFWQRLCEALERADLVDKHATTGDEAVAVRRTLASIFKTKTRDEWERIMTPADCCVSPVLSFEEAIRHPQFLERDMLFQDAETGVTAGFSFPAQINRGSCANQQPAPKLGEATAHYLEECGYPGGEIRRLADAAVVKLG